MAGGPVGGLSWAQIPMYVGSEFSLHLLELAGIKPRGKPLAVVATLLSGPFTGLSPEGV